MKIASSKILPMHLLLVYSFKVFTRNNIIGSIKKTVQTFLLYFFLLTGLLVIYSCDQNKPLQFDASVKKDTLKPAAAIAAQDPVVTFIDACPPPRRVIIPTKPGGFVLRKSDIGLKRIQSLPPEKKPAGLFIPMQNFGTEDGLALDAVYSICEDKNGNIWFGTAGAGVSRYDGKSFTTFTIAQGLGDNFVWDIYADKKGNVWFVSLRDKGISCYDGRTFINYTTSQGLVSNSVTSIIEDRNGNLWFGTTNGLSRYDPHNKSFKNFTTADGLPNDFVLTLLEDRQGSIWIGCRGGVSRLDQSGKSVSIFPAMAGKNLMSMIEDKSGNLFFGCYEGLYCLYREERSIHGDKAGVTEYSIAKGLVSTVIEDIIEDRSGKIWLATRGGLSRFDPNTTSFKTGHAVFTNFKKEQGLPNDYLLDIIEDHKGNIWIASNGGGVSRLDQGGRVIQTYTTAQGLTEDHILCVVEGKNQDMWFGTEGGVSILNHDEKSFKGLTTAQGLVDYWVESIIEDKNNDIWFCTFGDGVSRMDSEGKIITTYSTAQGLVSNLILDILEDKKGNIWFGSDSGVSRYDEKTVTNYTSEQGLVNNFVYEIAEDKKGNLWIATEGGISRFNLNGKSLPGAKIDITNFTTEQGLVHNSVRSILEDDNGTLWFGTNGGGCSRYDGKTFLNFTTADGLPDDVVYDIVKDKEGNLWLGTSKGLTVLKGFIRKSNPNIDSVEIKLLQSPGKLSNDEIIKGGCKPVFEIYHASTGYPIKDIYGNSLCVSKDNILWAGTGENLVRFDYNAVYKDTESPRVFIQNLKVNNEKIPWNNLLYPPTRKGQLSTGSSGVSPAGITEEVTLFGRALNDKQRDTLQKKFSGIKFDSIARFYPVPIHLVLPYRHNSLTFDFTAIETARPTLVNYQYILEGYNDDWSPASNETSASFGNIYEGIYTFQLKAQSPDGVWSKPLLYTFEVLPPWYRSWWALALYALVFSLVVWSFIRWRLKVLKKEKARLEEKLILQSAVMNERTRISRELHDEVGATLSGIAMYSHLTKEQIKNANTTEVEKSLNIMQQSAGEMVNKLNDIVWLVNPDQDSLQKLVQRLEEYARDMAAIKNMQVKVSVPEHLQENSLPLESRRNIYLFCKEAINNAVKYSNGSLLELTVKEVDNKLEFSVSDNGKGFDSVTVRRGNGLENMQKRADEIGAKLLLQSEKGQGCTVSMHYKVIQL